MKLSQPHQSIGTPLHTAYHINSLLERKKAYPFLMTTGVSSFAEL